MKFSVQSKTLLGQLASVGKVINQKSPIAILSNFLLELDGGTLVATGTDQDIVITTRIPVCEAEGSGRFCIEAKRVLEFLKAMPDSTATFEVDDKTLAVVVKYTNGQFDLVAQDGAAYPADGNVFESGTVAEFSMPSAQILKCLGKVGFAAGRDDFRPQMQGVFWDVKEDAIVFVATDTRQLAKYRCTQTAPGKECQFIMSSKAVQMVENIIGKDASVRVKVSEKSVRFDGDGFSVRCCLVSGRYPDYDRVIPKDNGKVVTVGREALLNAVKRVAICADPQHGLIKLAISPLDILVTSQDLGFSVGGKESVPCAFNGGEMLIAFASGYLTGLLDALTTNDICIRLGDNTRPGLFLPAENDEFGELTLLCMPMSISDAG